MFIKSISDIAISVISDSMVKVSVIACRYVDMNTAILCKADGVLLQPGIFSLCVRKPFTLRAVCRDPPVHRRVHRPDGNNHRRDLLTLQAIRPLTARSAISGPPGHPKHSSTSPRQLSSMPRVILTGIFSGSRSICRTAGWERWCSVLLALLGVGILGVGICPGNRRRPIAALCHVHFIIGGIARCSRSGGCIDPVGISLSCSGQSPPVSLLFAGLLIPGGDGGTERWIA